MSVSNLFLFKRNGVWYIIYTVDGRRQWKSTKCTDKREALKKLAEFKSVTKDRPLQITVRNSSMIFFHMLKLRMQKRALKSSLLHGEPPNDVDG